MALSSKMDDAVHMLVLHQLQHTLKVANVHADKLVVGLVLDILQVGEVAGIGQLVEINDFILRILVDKEPDNMAADESGTAGDDDVSFHISKNLGQIY